MKAVNPKQRILVVEDDPDLNELMRLSLEQAGFAVVACTNGIEGLDAARSQLPDLVVLDLVLPEMDGFTVCETLRRERATAGIPILMLTGLTSELNRFAALEAGAGDYIAKPVTMEQLLLKIRALLNHCAGADLARKGKQAPEGNRG
jgi:DNA-binding response OmpR family regulator